MLVARRRLVAGTGLAGLVGGLSRRAWGEGPPGLCTPSVPQEPTVDRPPPQRNAEDFSEVEVGMAFRNHGMLAELLKSDITPLGAHYLLVHFDVPSLSADGYSVALGGRVQSPRAIPLSEIKAAPEVRQVVTMECAGVGRRRLSPRPLYVPWEDEEIGTYQWVGTPLGPFLEGAGLDPSAVEVLFTGWDSGVDQGVEHAFERSMPLADALRPEVMLAWGANGQELLPEHGFPLRLVVPSWYGMASVKWLRAITVLSQPFRGMQQTKAYVYEQVADDPNAVPVREKRVMSVMAPPGVPDFQSRWRFLAPGPVMLEGLAWSGTGAVEVVQVSTDGGTSWGAAQLVPTSPDPYAWVRWRFPWNAAPGQATLVCRAQDSSGAVQPVDPQAAWNYGGNAVNAAQRTEVVVQSGVGSAAQAVPCAPRAALPGADVPERPQDANQVA